MPRQARGSLRRQRRSSIPSLTARTEDRRRRFAGSIRTGSGSALVTVGVTVPSDRRSSAFRSRARRHHRASPGRHGVVAAWQARWAGGSVPAPCEVTGADVAWAEWLVAQLEEAGPAITTSSRRSLEGREIVATSAVGPSPAPPVVDDPTVETLPEGSQHHLDSALGLMYALRVIPEQAAHCVTTTRCAAACGPEGHLVPFMCRRRAAARARGKR